MQRVSILGVPIDNVSEDEAIMKLSSLLQGVEKHHVMTPNNEMLVEAHHNETFRSLFSTTSLNLPDSTGVVWAAKKQGMPLKGRVTGVDTVKRLCLSLSDATPVFFLGGRNGAAANAATNLKRENPRLVIHTYEGSPSKDDAANIIARINDSGAHLLCVAYGSPQQDLWINQHLLQLTSVRVAMGVGGTFDFLSGRVPRAPIWMQRAGLEWLFRLLTQPRRIGRIVKATVVFPLLVLRKNS